MATVKVKGIEKVCVEMLWYDFLHGMLLLIENRILQSLTKSRRFPMAYELRQKPFPDPSPA
jgi:hypothetical protein